MLSGTQILRLSSIAVLSAFLVNAYPSFSGAQDKKPELSELIDDVTKLIQSMKSEVSNLKDENRRYKEELMRLEELQQEMFNADTIVLSGAVVAFDLEQGCPSGWTNVGLEERERFAGRTVIAVGPAAFRRHGSESTIERRFDDQGGNEETVLRPDDLPPHTHAANEDARHAVADSEQTVSSSFPIRDVDGSKIEPNLLRTLPIKNVGDSRSHNNMQPFIALHLCRKD